MLGNIKKVVTNIKNNVVDVWYNKLEEEVENIKYYIMNGYDQLSTIVTDTNSKSNPIYYRDKFEDHLDDFEFIQTIGKQITLSLPDMENFNFTGLEIIEQILEGTVGKYVEINEEDLEKITGKKIINAKPIDHTVSKKDRIYLEKDDADLRKRERNILDKKLVRFPFSDVPPQDHMVFGAGREYVDDNIELWVKEFTKYIEKTSVLKSRGVVK